MRVRESKGGPGGEEGKHQHGGSELDGQSLLKELPRDGHVIVEADMGDEEVGQLDGGQVDPGRAEAAAELHRPEQRVAVLVLR